MKISLIHPSRGRAEKSIRNVENWILNAGKGVEIETVLSIDLSDPDRTEYTKLYAESWVTSTVMLRDNSCVVDAANVAAKASTGDILIYCSDDFKVPENWGQLLVKEFEGIQNPTLLHVDDCLQKFTARVLTIPIMNRALYEKLGYFFHPDYKSMWVDCDLYETCDRIGVIKKAPHLKLPHEHHCIGKAANDETYRRSEANWNQGKKVFDRRKRQGFPI